MSDYDHIEKVLAEIIVEVTGEPRIGRFERTVAKQALARLRECGMTMVERVTEVSEPQGEPSDAQVEAAARRLFGATVDSMTRARELARIALTAKPLIECPHWAPGKITFRNGCTGCAADVGQEGDSRG